MNCANHPETTATSFCVNCGKALCTDCTIQVDGKSYCQQCLQEGALQPDLPSTHAESTQPNRLALLSLCLGIIGWLFFLMELCFDITLGTLAAFTTLSIALLCLMPVGLVPYLGWIGAVVTGHIAMLNLKSTENQTGGRGMAIAGLVLGYLPLLITLLGIAIVVILVAVLLAFGAPIPTLNNLFSQLQ